MRHIFRFTLLHLTQNPSNLKAEEDWTASTLLFHLAEKVTKVRLLSEEYELRLNDDDVAKLGLSKLDNAVLPPHIRFLEISDPSGLIAMSSSPCVIDPSNSASATR